MKKWIVTYIDCGDSCDCKPRVLAVCDTKEKAKETFLTDWNHYIYHLWQIGIDKDELVMDVDKMSICMPGNNIGREWNIEEVAV